ncbi:MAG: ATP-dependent DNA helicase RecG [Treponema sp.]
MKIADIKNPVSSLQGAGPATIKHLANLNIFTIGDLLQFYPRDYEDRTKRIPLNQFAVSKKIHTIAKVCAHEYFGYGKMKTLKIIIQDETGKAALIAFNRNFLEQTLPVNSIICVTGTFEVKYNELQSSSFETILIKKDGELEEFKNAVMPDSGILPVYRLTQGITRKTIVKLMNQAIRQYAIGLDDELPEQIIKSRSLLSKKEAVKKIHQPQNMNDAIEAKKTLVYEELFLFQTAMLKRAFLHKGTFPEPDFSDFNSNVQSQAQAQSEKSDYSPRQSQLLDSLSFSLTKDQLDVINQMNREIDRGYKERNLILHKLENDNSPSAEKDSNLKPFTMQRLVQGDVGSGKTLVALFAALRVIDWGGQVAFMAPTEILARQHAENINRYVEKFGVRTAFLTGNVKTAGRKTLLKELKTGGIDILIGTHALFSTDVIYKDLQLAIIDEQHRFGVLQRQAIIEKGRQLLSSVYASPHLLMMSATPIPQTLALTAFGDLDISTIKTLPQGRKKIITYLVSGGHEQNAYNAVRQELDKGHQAYLVYPAIDSQETTSDLNAELNADLFSSSDSESIKSAEKAFNELSSTYFSKYKCALIHSKIPEEQQTRILDDFRYGKIKMLFATTVVEVGVDVPNATCIVIEQADRFGLSQLHQLRGRIGRGNSQSYCFLIYRKNITENGIQRMKILRESTDGFFIAEEDLKLRGPGEITGTIQSGDLKLGIADLSRDHALLLEARKDALKILKNK